MTAATLPALTEAEIITCGWKVYRAAQDMDWPQEHARSIVSAVVVLGEELFKYGTGDGDGRHARDISYWAAEVIDVIARYCGPDAAAQVAARGRTA